PPDGTGSAAPETSSAWTCGERRCFARAERAIDAHPATKPTAQLVPISISISARAAGCPDLGRAIGVNTTWRPRTAMFPASFRASEGYVCTVGGQRPVGCRNSRRPGAGFPAKPGRLARLAPTAVDIGKPAENQRRRGLQRLAAARRRSPLPFRGGGDGTPFALAS